jgi:hypothetical protein
VDEVMDISGNAIGSTLQVALHNVGNYHCCEGVQKVLIKPKDMRDHEGWPACTCNKASTLAIHEGELIDEVWTSRMATTSHNSRVCSLLQPVTLNAAN